MIDSGLRLCDLKERDRLYVYLPIKDPKTALEIMNRADEVGVRFDSINDDYVVIPYLDSGKVLGGEIVRPVLKSTILLINDNTVRLNWRELPGISEIKIQGAGDELASLSERKLVEFASWIGYKPEELKERIEIFADLDCWFDETAFLYFAGFFDNWGSDEHLSLIWHTIQAILFNKNYNLPFKFL